MVVYSLMLHYFLPYHGVINQVIVFYTVAHYVALCSTCLIHVAVVVLLHGYLLVLPLIVLDEVLFDFTTCDHNVSISYHI